MSTLPDHDDRPDILHCALWLAGRGMFVSPVDHPDLPRCAGIGRTHDPGVCTDRGKHPCVPFTRDSTTDPQVIAAWYAGSSRNIGIDCGRSGLLVVDEDAPGEFARWAASHGHRLPGTFTVTTAKGAHHYFRAPADTDLSVGVRPFTGYSVDYRAAGGYVVGPGSVHATGHVYRPVDSSAPIAPCPDWLVEALCEARGRRTPPARQEAAQVTERPQDGTDNRPGVPILQARHDTLMRYAGRLRGLGLEIDEALPTFRRRWEDCAQPPQADHPFPWSEAEALVRDVFSRYEPNPLGDETGEDVDERQIRLTPIGSIAIKPTRWTWDDRIPTGAVSLVAGRGGIGKSTFLAHLSAHLSRGTLQGAHYGRPGAVFYAATEDSWSHTIVPRLVASGADVERVFRLDVVTRQTSIGPLTLPADLAALERRIVEYAPVVLILDPLMSCIGLGIDSYKDQEVRTALEPLAALAERTGLSVIGNTHFTKASSPDPASLVMGSAAFVNVVRAAIGCVVDDADEAGGCVMSQIKNNLGRMDLPSLRYVIEERQVPSVVSGEPARVGILRFTGKSDRSVADVLKGPAGTAVTLEAQAEAWLPTYLLSRDGRAPSEEVKAAGEPFGFKDKTLQRVAAKVGVQVASEGFPRRTVWIMPAGPAGTESDEEQGRPFCPVAQSRNGDAREGGPESVATGECPSRDSGDSPPDSVATVAPPQWRQNPDPYLMGATVATAQQEEPGNTGMSRLKLNELDTADFSHSVTDPEPRPCLTAVASNAPGHGPAEPGSAYCSGCRGFFVQPVS